VGRVRIDRGAHLVGTIEADQLTINRNGQLSEPAPGTE
jgi:cytoskeletal protein CcmA (bactofilin family)